MLQRTAKRVCHEFSTATSAATCAVQWLQSLQDLRLAQPQIFGQERSWHEAPQVALLARNSWSSCECSTDLEVPGLSPDGQLVFARLCFDPTLFCEMRSQMYRGLQDIGINTLSHLPDLPDAKWSNGGQPAGPGRTWKMTSDLRYSHCVYVSKWGTPPNFYLTNGNT